MNTIDLVVPYVDSSDKEWQKLFDKYSPKTGREEIDAKNRFRGQGEFFRYFFRGIEKYMPFIRKVHLIVQSDSQVPKWINRDKVNIVYHKDIIPEEYLPTFNSCTIEMFIQNIPDLSEYYIYTNDDVFAYNMMTPELFFKEDKVKNITRGIRDKKSMYSQQCINAYCLAYDKDKDTVINEMSVIPALSHRMRPYIKSVVQKAFDVNKEKILSSITSFRDYKNINVYYFDHFIIRERRQASCDNLNNACINSDTSSQQILTVLTSTVNMVCLQDTDEDKDIYSNYTIRNAFAAKFKDKSKYEV